MDVEVWWSSIVAADDAALALLDATERARLGSLDSPADRGRSAVGAALLRVAVAARLGTDPRDVVVDRTCTECGRPHGAPRVVGPGSWTGSWTGSRTGSAVAAPRVSVSHSGLLVVVALSGGSPVGVDVQREADLPGAAGPAEAAAWVRHEAGMKLQGAALAVGDEVHPDADVVTTPLVAPLDGYAAALATVGRPGRPVVRHWPGRGGDHAPDADDGAA
ncbi:hypothetical protein Q9R32_01355 [Actinotalea sp. AC32]|nr:hypothetical protein [Actinotalea sp. AC32]